MTLRKLMLLMPVIALIVLALARINPLRRDPHQQAIDRKVLRCSDPTSNFDATHRFDWAEGARPKPILDKPPLRGGRCVLRIDYPNLVMFDENKCLDYSGSHVALSEDGRIQGHGWTPMSHKGSSRQIPPENVKKIEQMLASLPWSMSDISTGPTEEGHWTLDGNMIRFQSNAVVIGFRSWGRWVTRVYDYEHLPPEVSELLDTL